MQQLPDIVQPVIAHFLAASYDADTPRRRDPPAPELCAYAARAMTGCIL